MSPPMTGVRFDLKSAAGGRHGSGGLHRRHLMGPSKSPRTAPFRPAGNRRPSWRSVFALLFALIMIAEGGGIVLAAPTSRQRSSINTLKRKASRVEELCRQQAFDDAAKELQEIQDQYSRLLAESDREPGLLPLLEPLYLQMLRAHARLELEGWSLAAPKNPNGPTGMPGNGTVSFQGQVAGILVEKCGRCHVTAARGGFQMANFSGLVRGSEAGTVLVPGDADGSRLVEVIESGDMPRGGLRVTSEELTTLKTWITEGALFDGEDPERSLSEMVTNGSPSTPEPEVVPASGQESVRFARDLAPVLAQHCTGCHGDGRQNSSQLDLSNFAGLVRGGENGPILKPGSPSESLLIHKLRGSASGARMPRGQPPLEESIISQFETWIEERATFDGRDPRAHVREVAAFDRALHASHEELKREREALAQQNWRLSFPGVEPTEARTDHFYLLGNVGERALADVGQRAEELVPKVANLLKIPSGQPVVRGAMTLFVVSGRYDYSEFGKMVEQRQLPSSWRGHWRHTVVDSYSVLLTGGSADFDEDALLTQLIAANHLASLGPETPHWFAEGAARMAVARIAPRDARIVEWDRQTPELLRGMSKPDDFLADRLGPEAADLAAYRFVRFLATRDARKFQALLKGLREGTSFPTAFETAYQATPEQLAPAWVHYDARRR